MLNTGLIINGRYRIVKLLGQGGFGAVYRAWDINLNQARALKINLDTSSEARRQFQREASTLAGLSHPNLPRVTDHFFVEGQGQFLVMDYADGEDLEAIVTREGQLAPEKAVPIITQIADALAYLHRQEPPIIHRDIKPANIRVTADGHVFLVDFGLAKIYDQKLRTTIGARAVTPGYSPPEQYGQGNTDVLTDVYALAATLYTMLTGDEPQESVQRIVEDKMQPVVQINPAISEPISAALLQAMSLNPSQRYQNVDDFVQSLQQHQTHAELTTSPANQPQSIKEAITVTSTPPPSGNGINPILWILGTAVLLLVVFFVFILPMTRQQAAQELALQITRQASGTRVAATSTAESEGTETAVAFAMIEATATRQAEKTATQQAIIQATTTRQAEKTATQQAIIQATATRQAEKTATVVSARATSSARTTATQQARFTRATATVRARNNTITAIETQATRVFGPSSGSLVHEEDGFIEADYASVSLKNFITESQFTNPYSRATGSWSYGFLFRDESDGQFLLAISSAKYWTLWEYSDDDWNDIDSGSISDLKVNADQSNEIRLICQDDQGWLFVNDKFIVELDLSSRTNSGYVGIATGGDEIDGEKTRYTGFTVWSLP